MTSHGKVERDSLRIGGVCTTEPLRLDFEGRGTMGKGCRGQKSGWKSKRRLERRVVRFEHGCQWCESADNEGLLHSRVGEVV